MGIEIGPGLGGSSLLPCAGACAARVGLPHEPAVLAGLFGHAFESSYALGGEELWTACALEWGPSFARGLDRLGVRREVFDSTGKPPGRPREEERRAALERAFRSVVTAASRGLPALVWSPMSPAQKQQGLSAHCWGVIEGVDEPAGLYRVVHRDAGRFTVPAMELGRVDPVEWFHLEVFLGPDEAHDRPAAFAGALADGAKLLAGEIAGADMPASRARLRHGPAALDAWASDVRLGKCEPAGWRARFWSNARPAAAAFCRAAAGVLPVAAEALERAAVSFTAQAELFARILSGESAAELARRVADLHPEGLSNLQVAVTRATP